MQKIKQEKLQAKKPLLKFFEASSMLVAQGIALDLMLPEDWLLLLKTKPSGPGPHLGRKRP